MLIDSYETPGAESLLLLGRERHSDGSHGRRLLTTEAGTAALFIAVAGALAVFANASRTLSLPALAVTVVAYLVAGRVQYPVAVCDRACLSCVGLLIAASAVDRAGF